MSNIKLYLIKFAVLECGKIGLAEIAAESGKKAQEILQGEGKYNGYKYAMEYPQLVHTTDTVMAPGIISELDNPAGEKGDRGPRGLKGDTGERGPKGDPFVYSDFTSEQLANLKGEKGDKGNKGDKGDKGDPLTWDSMDPEDKITLKEDIEENVKNDLKNGYYPAMTVGKAENLVGRGESTEEKISFRPSAGSLSIEDGSAKITSIKGNSVVWNQQIKTLIVGGRDEIVKNGITFKKTPNGYHISGDNNTSSYVFSNDSGNLSVKANHYYLFDIVGCDKSYINIYLSGIGFSLNGRISEIKQAKIDGNAIVRLTVAPNTTVVDEYVSCQVIDLTQMFGAGNEPTSYEKYLKHKPMNIANEYAYNAGTIVDMRVNEIKSVGDNAYNPNLGYARVLGGKEYNIHLSVEGLYEMYFSRTLEGDKEPIDAISNPMTFPADGYVWIIGVNGEPLHSDNICICLQHSYPKPVIPFEQDVKDISFINELFPNGMRSVSAAPNFFQHIYDEIFFNKTIKKWTLIKRIGSTVVTKDTPINKDTNAQCAFTINRQNLQLDGIPKTYGGCTTNNYGLNKSSSVRYKGLYFNNSLLIFNLGDDSNITTVEALKSLLETRPLQINYELAEPEVTELDIDFTPYYEIWDFGTEEAIASGASTPFRADIVYQFNAVDRIRNNSTKIAELEAKIQSLTLAISALQTNE